MKSISLIAAILLVASGWSFSVPPRDPDYLKTKPVSFRPCRSLPQNTINRMKAMGALRKAGEQGIGMPAVKRVLVIRVDFAGKSIATSQAETEAFFDQVTDYYRENSYGVLTVTATITQVCSLPNTISAYNRETDADLIRLRDDSIQKALSYGIDFSTYNYIMIYHAGYGEEETQQPGDIWSLFYGSNFTVSSAGGTRAFDGFTVVPEKSFDPDNSPLGVICHEFGHQLGLPDLYNTSVDGGQSTCGAWSVMDYPYGADNSGRNPPHLDPWSKEYLKFIDLSARTVSGRLSAGELGPIETSQTTGYYKIPVDVGGTNEYFIVEYRRPDAATMKYDLTIPATGVLIWHIDDSIALDGARLGNNTVNSGDPHHAVDLVEADGTANYPPGNGGDAFSNGATFASPLSDAFNKLQSGIAVAGIGMAGQRVTFAIDKIAASAAISITKAINYPNPAGTGYPHPRAGVLTTLVLQVVRPPETIDLAIYTLSGERIMTGIKENFSLKIGTSSDYKWVYEYDWNGKNDSGEDVAPGVYLYRIKADGFVKVGKMAVVR